jgi:hypothetical protein
MIELLIKKRYERNIIKWVSYDCYRLIGQLDDISQMDYINNVVNTMILTSKSDAEIVAAILAALHKFKPDEVKSFISAVYNPEDELYKSIHHSDYLSDFLYCTNDADNLIPTDIIKTSY